MVAPPLRREDFAWRERLGKPYDPVKREFAEPVKEPEPVDLVALVAEMHRLTHELADALTKP